MENAILKRDVVKSHPHKDETKLTTHKRAPLKLWEIPSWL